MGGVVHLYTAVEREREGQSCSQSRAKREDAKEETTGGLGMTWMAGHDGRAYQRFPRLRLTSSSTILRTRLMPPAGAGCGAAVADS